MSRELLEIMLARRPPRNHPHQNRHVHFALCGRFRGKRIGQRGSEGNNRDGRHRVEKPGAAAHVGRKVADVSETDELLLKCTTELITYTFWHGIPPIADPAIHFVLHPTAWTHRPPQCMAFNSS